MTLAEEPGTTSPSVERFASYAVWDWRTQRFLFIQSAMYLPRRGARLSGESSHDTISVSLAPVSYHRGLKYFLVLVAWVAVAHADDRKSIRTVVQNSMASGAEADLPALVLIDNHTKLKEAFIYGDG